jgi:adenine-specific DNA-methyltransferase
MPNLSWENKRPPAYLELPFQTIETINESKADREARLSSLFQNKTTIATPYNRLIWGDKKYVLPSLLPEYRGKINLIYIDPPFMTDSNFSFKRDIPQADGEKSTVDFIKQPSFIEQRAYYDTWGGGIDTYLQWFYETALILRELLADNGSIYVHLDWHVGHYAKLVLDEVFGYDNFRNEILTRRGQTKNLLGQFEGIKSMNVFNDSLFWYSKNSNTRFNPPMKQAEAYQMIGSWQSMWSNADRPTMRYELLGSNIESGQWKWSKERAFKAVENYKKYEKEFAEQLTLEEYWVHTNKKLEFIKKEGKGKPVYFVKPREEVICDNNWFDIKGYDYTHKYATEKSEVLLERIIKASSNEGDLVLDCFCGSGTTAAVAEKLGRRWITCDLGRFAIHTARKRLLSIQGVRPFVVQNLGKYERQQWITQEMGKENLSEQIAMQQEYYGLILDLYGAERLKGQYSYLQGIKAGRAIHVGGVDAPVTVEDIWGAIKEFWAMGKVGESEGESKNGIDFLGWDFAFDINETATQMAAENKVKISCKRIPRETLQKEAVSNVKFYELASLQLAQTIKQNELTIGLENFIIPLDDVPKEIQDKISHWEQWVDYWAVDWDYKNDTFHNQWQSYRSRQNPKLELTARHSYETKGKYKVLVKVIDILGNDTTKVVEVVV